EKKTVIYNIIIKIKPKHNIHMIIRKKNSYIQYHNIN
uniref:Uncharacterized protein n=1 Tax=Cucumis melo TaxID=3656 RepID=A0A9I9EK26_CUCME